MGKSIVEKIFSSHLSYGEMKAGSPVGLTIDEVYTQDATGTMTWLQFEAMCIDRVRVPLAVSYVDHNMIQSNFMNPDDHLFLQTVAAKFGAYFSKPGNGICHQVNLERFARPGWIGLGTDSHTPTNGGMGMIAIGVGGLDAAMVMAGNPFEITMPKVVQVKLTGSLQRPYVSAMDIILELLRRKTVKGGVGTIFEYGGDGVADLNVMERSTITNMGAELGATTSVFPSDENTKAFLAAQKREADWTELKADEDASYDEVIEINLDELEPLIAQPHSPDAVVPIRELAGTTVDQVCIGSCTNSSYQVMRTVASVLKGRKVADTVNLHINPGSKQVYEMIARDGSLAEMIAAGARMLEASCGPCIGMGGSPATGHVSVRTFNRNFKGRSGNKEAFTYLASTVSSIIMAIRGEMIDPRESGIPINSFEDPVAYPIDNNLLIPPLADTSAVQVIKGPNIKEVPVKEPPREEIVAEVLLKLGDNITTDDIMPAGSAVLPFRSNIPAIAEYVFYNLDSTFAERAKKALARGGGVIIGAGNYGQGSSREHAALAPMHLGVQAVITKSFARIHRSNLINFGIVPLLFENPDDYDLVAQGDRLLIKDIKKGLEGDQRFEVVNETKGDTFVCISNLNDREKEIITTGGLLSYARKMCALNE